MNSALKIVGGILAGSVLTFSGTTLADNTEVIDAQVHEAQVAEISERLTDEQSDKLVMAKYYVDARVRLGEPLTQDISIISNEELSAVLIDLATEKGALDPQKPNLIEALHDKAVEEGKACR